MEDEGREREGKVKEWKGTEGEQERMEGGGRKGRGRN